MHYKQDRDYNAFIVSLFSIVPVNSEFRWGRQWWKRSGEYIATNEQGKPKRFTGDTWIAIRRSEMYK